MRSTTTKMLAGAAVLTLALSACGNGGTTTTPTGSGSAAPASSTAPANQGAEFAAEYNKQPYANLKDGGTLNLTIGEITTTLNQFEYRMTTDTSILWDWYNPVLIAYEANGDVIYNPDYIVSHKDEVKDGKTVVTYDLNEAAVFNDGTPIDFNAFVNTWKSNIGAEGYESNSTDGYVLIESVERGENDKQVVITFKQTYAWHAGLFNRVLHPAVDNADKFTNAYVGGTLESAHPEWGAGPYKLTQLNEQQGVAIFEPNEKWWGENKAKLEKVTFQVRESVAALNAFKNGETDMVGASSNENLSQIKSMTDIDIRRGATPAIFMITLNSEGEILSDIKVREAIARGVNREQIAAVQFNGLDYTEEAPGSFVLYPYQTGYRDNFGEVVEKFDAEAAIKVLEEAGWVAGADGIREKDGKKLTLNLPIFGDAQLTKARAQAVQAQMKEIGVEINVVAKASSDFSNVMKEKDFDLTISGFRSSDPYGVAYFCQIFCSDSTLNKSGTGTTAIDEKIKAMEQLATPEEQIKVANDIEVEALETYGMVPLFSGVTIYGAKKGLANSGAGVFAVDGRGNVNQRELIGWEK